MHHCSFPTSYEEKILITQITKIANLNNIILNQKNKKIQSIIFVKTCWNSEGRYRITKVHEHYRFNELMVKKNLFQCFILLFTQCKIKIKWNNYINHLKKTLILFSLDIHFFFLHVIKYNLISHSFQFFGHIIFRMFVFKVLLIRLRIWHLCLKIKFTIVIYSKIY